MNKKRKMLWMGNLSLMMILGYIVVRSMNLFSPVEIVSTPQSALAAQKPEVVADSSPANPQMDYRRIVQHDLFGTANVDSASQASSKDLVLLEKLPPINMRLCGTIAGPEEIARALIREPALESTSLYRIGDVVQGGKIIKINKDSIVLKFSGRQVVLRLEITAATEKTETNENEMTEPVGEMPISAVMPKLMGMETREKEGALETLLRRATMTSYPNDNQSEGLKISNLEDIEMARLIGLREGDVICRVNGQATTTKQKAFQVLKKARTQPQLEIELMRKNEKKSLSIPLRW